MNELNFLQEASYLTGLKNASNFVVGYKVQGFVMLVECLFPIVMI